MTECAPKSVESDAETAKIDENEFVLCIIHGLLQGIERIGPCTGSLEQLSTLDYESLVQRQIELQEQMILVDAQLEAASISLPPKSWSSILQQYDDRYDILAEEADYIEEIMVSKFNEKGGGRLLIGDSISEASSLGRQLSQEDILITGATREDKAGSSNSSVVGSPLITNTCVEEGQMKNAKLTSFEERLAPDGCLLRTLREYDTQLALIDQQHKQEKEKTARESSESMTVSAVLGGRQKRNRPTAKLLQDQAQRSRSYQEPSSPRSSIREDEYPHLGGEVVFALSLPTTLFSPSLLPSHRQGQSDSILSNTLQVLDQDLTSRKPPKKRRRINPTLVSSFRPAIITEATKRATVDGDESNPLRSPFSSPLLSSLVSSELQALANATKAVLNSQPSPQSELDHITKGRDVVIVGDTIPTLTDVVERRRSHDSDESSCTSVSGGNDEHCSTFSSSPFAFSAASSSVAGLEFEVDAGVSLPNGSKRIDNNEVGLSQSLLQISIGETLSVYLEMSSDTSFTVVYQQEGYGKHDIVSFAGHLWDVRTTAGALRSLTHSGIVCLQPTLQRLSEQEFLLRIRVFFSAAIFNPFTASGTPLYSSGQKSSPVPILRSENTRRAFTTLVHQWNHSRQIESKSSYFFSLDVSDSTVAEGNEVRPPRCVGTLFYSDRRRGGYGETRDISRTSSASSCSPSYCLDQLELTSLYDALRPSPSSREMLEPRELVSKLRPYQRKALYWMYFREKRQAVIQNPLWKKIFFCNRFYWYQPFSGEIRTEITEEPLGDVSGGILADEMGLGKTIEMASLILSHRADASHCFILKPYRQQLSNTTMPVLLNEEEGKDETRSNKRIKVDATSSLTIPEKTRPSSPVPALSPSLGFLDLISPSPQNPLYVKTTLIITPVSILRQWEDELKKHAPFLSVCLYNGQKLSLSTKSKRGGQEQGKRKGGVTTHPLPLSCFDLASHDVVLSTYQVLREEVNYSTTVRYPLRHEKRFAIPQTPLLQLHFWRLVLDEAQFIERTVASSAKMANRLRATHRWCVTGTPIRSGGSGNGLEDLYGLFVFLQLSPWDQHKWWLRGISRPYFRDGDCSQLYALLRRVLWRHSKSHVSDEICLPPLTTHDVFLDFSAIEEEFYKKMLLDVESQVYHDVHAGIVSDKNAIGRLETLRQACNHPQVGRSSFLGTQQILTMPEIMTRMIEKSRQDLGVGERDLCRALNALAIICLRQGTKIEKERAKKLLDEAWHIEDGGITSTEKYSTGGITSTGEEGSEFLSENGKGGEREEDGKKEHELIQTAPIPEKNSVYHQWMLIQVVTIFHLLNYYQNQTLELERELRLLKEHQHQPQEEEDNNNNPLSAHVHQHSLVSSIPFPSQTSTALGNSVKTRLEFINRQVSRLQSQYEATRSDLLESSLLKLSALRNLLHVYEHVNVPSFLLDVESVDIRIRQMRSFINLEEKNREGGDEVNDGSRVDISGGFQVLCDDEEFFKNLQNLEAELTTLRAAASRDLRVCHLLLRIHELKRLLYLQRTSTDVVAHKSLYLREILARSAMSKLSNPDLLKGDEGNALSPSLCKVFSTGLQDLQKEVSAIFSTTATRKSIFACNNISEGSGQQAAPSPISLQESLSYDEQEVLKRHHTARRIWGSSVDSITLIRNLRAIRTIRKQLLPEALERLQHEEDNLDLFLTVPLPLSSETGEVSSHDETKIGVFYEETERCRQLQELQEEQKRMHDGLIVLRDSVSRKERHIQYLRYKFRCLTAARIGGLEEKDEELTCVICHRTPPLHPILTPCAHIYCRACVETIFTPRSSGTASSTLDLSCMAIPCAICRQKIDKSGLYEIMDEMNKRGEKQQEEKGESKDIPFSFCSRSSNPPHVVLQIPIRGEGNYGTKIEVLVKYLLYLRSSHSISSSPTPFVNNLPHNTAPMTKCIVYSQWLKMLQIVSKALHDNDIKFLLLEGTAHERGEKIHSFQTNPSIQVLLLSLRKDSSGINLVQATHVFLLEPSLNFSEDQAMNRIHRIGQNCPTFAHRFVIRRSIEEKILEVQNASRRVGLGEDGIAAQSRKEKIDVLQLLKLLDF